MPKIPFKYIFYFFTLYVTAASLWWGYLLYRKNDELYAAKIELMETKYVKSVEGTDDYTYLIAKKIRQERMIMGEGSVFFILFSRMHEKNVKCSIIKSFEDSQSVVYSLIIA